MSKFISLNQIIRNNLAEAMCNPNSELYLPRLTLDKVQSIFAEMPEQSSELCSIFWHAYADAKHIFEAPRCKFCGNILKKERLGSHTAYTCPRCDMHFLNEIFR